eukprot:747873-Hanusia_phi.AAC.2
MGLIVGEKTSTVGAEGEVDGEASCGHTRVRECEGTGTLYDDEVEKSRDAVWLGAHSCLQAKGDLFALDRVHRHIIHDDSKIGV